MDHILQGGSNNPGLVLFSGSIGRAFHKLYSPIVAYKDELKALWSYPVCQNDSLLNTLTVKFLFTEICIQDFFSRILKHL